MSNREINQPLNVAFAKVSSHKNIDLHSSIEVK